jgi:hypothetical protein
VAGSIIAGVAGVAGTSISGRLSVVAVVRDEAGDDVLKTLTRLGIDKLDQSCSLRGFSREPGLNHFAKADAIARHRLSALTKRQRKWDLPPVKRETSTSYARRRGTTPIRAPIREGRGP